MDELIKVNYEGEKPTVSGRELHAALGVKTQYKDWFPRMCEYGFVRGTDFSSILSESTGGRPAIDHSLTIPMAKEICMLQRNEKGKKFRLYFLKIEEMWNSPEMVMQRALSFAKAEVDRLKTENTLQSQQLTELQPKACYYDLVLSCKDLLSISSIAKDYGWSAVKMNEYLHEQGVQYKQGKIWLLYQKYAEKGYTNTKTSIYCGVDGKQHSKVHTYWTQKGRLFIYDLLKGNGILPLVEK